MGEFVDAALSFPGAVLGVLLVVVVVYWLLVLLGTVEHDLGGHEIELGGLGLGGVPVTIIASVMVVVGWFVSLVGGLLLLGTGGLVLALGGSAVLLVALVAGFLAARLLVVPLRALTGVTSESRADFVGRECVIRTGSVSGSFGQAEVAAADGSSAIVQVRQTGEHALSTGSRALIFDYDIDGEYFWVAPV